jgi:hypothetical protein
MPHFSVFAAESAKLSAEELNKDTISLYWDMFKNTALLLATFG